MLFKELQLSDIAIFPSCNGFNPAKLELSNLVSDSKIPVYGSSMSGEPIGFTEDDISTVNYYENCLSWNRNGSAGFVFIRNHRFTTNEDHRALLIKDAHRNNLSLEYLKYTIQASLLSEGYNWGYKAGKDKVATTTIKIPINKKGEFDLNSQKKIAEKYKKIETFFYEIVDYAERIENANVQIEINSPTATVYLSDANYFDLSIGTRVLKKDIKPDGIPIYSANVMSHFGHIEKSNLSDFSAPSLLWGIDGVFDWNLIAKNQQFATTDHCGLLRIKNKKLYPQYVFHYLKNTKDRYGFDRVFRSSLSNIKDVVSVEVPIDSNGEFDLQKQVQIAESYNRIENLKNTIKLEIEKIKDINIDMDL